MSSLVAGSGSTVPLLAVDDLHVEFATRDGLVRAVNGVSFELRAGETIAILGESGSGKSVTAQAIMGILPTPPARITAGSIRLEGRELVGLRERDYRGVRGRQIAMIFQDALSSLNPVTCVGEQIAEMFRIHDGAGHGAAKAAAIEVMERVRIPGAARRYGDYPHQFSGGMRQRIMIAMMIALKPQVLIADEPTTALDVTIQAQVLEVLRRTTTERGAALLLITHDLGVVAETADRIAVMYAGQIVETGNAADVLRTPASPYTRDLITSIPSFAARGKKLATIKGMVPSPTDFPSGCRFAPRCRYAIAACTTATPPLAPVGKSRLVRCIRAKDVASGAARRAR